MGVGLVKATGSSTDDQACFGTRGWCASHARPGTQTRLKVKRTSPGAPGDTPSRNFHTDFWSSAGKRRNSSKVNTTSSAVKGCPSDHCTPWRSVKTSVRPSSRHSHAVASHGTHSPLTELKMASGSYTPAADGHRQPAMSGLKLRIHVACDCDAVRVSTPGGGSACGARHAATPSAASISSDLIAPAPACTRARSPPSSTGGTPCSRRAGRWGKGRCRPPRR